MDFQEKGGRWLKAQCFLPPIAPAVLPSGKSWGRTHTHTHTQSHWDTLTHTHTHTHTQSLSPKGRQPALPGTPAVFLFQMQNLLIALWGWQLLVALSLVSKGGWLFSLQGAGTSFPGKAPSRRQQRHTGFPWLPSFPGFQQSPDPRLTLTWEQTLVQTNAASTPRPGSPGGRGVGAHHGPSCHLGAGCHVLTSHGWFATLGEKTPTPAPSKKSPGRNFCRIPRPRPAALPLPLPACPLPPTAARWRSGWGRLARSVPSGSSPFLGEAGRAESRPSPQHPSQPPGPCLRGRAASSPRRESRGRRHLEFCPKKGGLEEEKEEEEERRDGGWRRETESGVQNSTGRGPERRQRRRRRRLGGSAAAPARSASARLP